MVHFLIGIGLIVLGLGLLGMVYGMDIGRWLQRDEDLRLTTIRRRLTR